MFSNTINEFIYTDYPEKYLIQSIPSNKKKEKQTFDPTIMLHPKIGNLKGIIVFQGNIGAGKSTLIDALESNGSHYKGHRLIFVKEPTELWKNFKSEKNEKPYNFLKMFYENMRSFAFPFQILCFSTMVASIHNEIKKIVETDEPYFIICERDLISSKEIFVKNLVELGVISWPEEAVLDYFFDTFAKPINDLVKLYIHLDVDPKVCLERLNQRNRREETTISLDYLKQIDEAHKALYENKKYNIPVFKLGWNTNLESKTDMYDYAFKNFQLLLNDLIEEKEFQKI